MFSCSRIRIFFCSLFFVIFRSLLVDSRKRFFGLFVCSYDNFQLNGIISVTEFRSAECFLGIYNPNNNSIRVSFYLINKCLKIFQTIGSNFNFWWHNLLRQGEMKLRRKIPDRIFLKGVFLRTIILTISPTP